MDQRGRQFAAQILAQAAGSSRPERALLLDNVNLIRTAERDIRELKYALSRLPCDESETQVPRVFPLAAQYLSRVGSEFREDTLTRHLDHVERYEELRIAEIWAFKPVLEYQLLERLSQAPPDQWGVLLGSLRRVGEAQWKEIFESVSVVHRVLSNDPAGYYARMDFETRDMYRAEVADIADKSGKTEHAVSQTAVELAEQVRRGGGEGRAFERRTHVGFFLADRGVEHLRALLGYRRPWRARARHALLNNPTALYLIGIELTTFAIVWSLLEGLDDLTPVLAGLALLLLPATQAAVDFMNNLVSFLTPPRALPKLDFSKGIPDDCTAMVAVPTLLLSEVQVRDLVLDLEIRFLANRDPNLCFALITDAPDSDRPTDERDALVDIAQGLIEGLNDRYGPPGHGPFYLFHRHRVFNASEGRWMGWERKRGKLVDLNQMMRGGFDSFPVKVGDLSRMRSIRYVITLDSDTQLPRDSAQRLVATMAHPLNRAVVDPVREIVVEGYGILQPRIGVSIQSASRSRLASLYSGQTGFDIYTRAVSDVYQDLFREGIFTGKGIYEVDVLRQVLEHRFPENALLSHDLIEGAYSRAGLATDIELVDDYPSHFSAYSRRKHRWVRGDWQILRWLLPRVPDFHGRLIHNPISLISRWKIVDNLRRSLFEPATLLLLLAGWFYLPGGAIYWTTASVCLLLMPVYSSLFFALLRAPWRRKRALAAWASDTAKATVDGHIFAALGIVFLLHQALLSLDAIGRSISRVFVTRKRLLEWETAAEAETEVRPKSTVDVYLEWTPYLAIVTGIALWMARPASLRVAGPILACWVASRVFSAWLNRTAVVDSRLSAADLHLLRDAGERTWRYFKEWSTASTNWLIPDNVEEDGKVAMRLSPTNLGMLLNARVAAVHLELLSLADFVRDTRETLTVAEGLARYRGHFYNWYDVETLEALEPRFVSTVDSGNLAAALWTLKQAAIGFSRDPDSRCDVTPELSVELLTIAGTCDRLVSEMDFRFLFQAKRKVLSVGFNATEQRAESSSYDLLASESRIASFVAIAKGDAPQGAWFHLDRRQTLFAGCRVLVSWTGTMFEYLMPALWMRHYPDTITGQSMYAAVAVQQEYARRRGVPWGISESACTVEGGCEYGYAPFGISAIAMKRAESEALVVSPYSTLLALTVAPRAAIDNLRRMVEFGWYGRYGFYEAVDYTRSGGEIIRSWMAHHQGMGLLAIMNLLFDNRLQQYFHAEPQVMATELLLHERVPTSAVMEVEESEPATV